MTNSVLTSNELRILHGNGELDTEFWKIVAKAQDWPWSGEGGFTSLRYNQKLEAMYGAMDMFPKS